MRISGLFSVSMIVFSSGALAVDQAAKFHILEPAEITRHVQTLAQLQGEEREQYRDRVYGGLVERAREHGYEMPAVPPWQEQAGMEPTNFRPEPTAEKDTGILPVTNTPAGPASPNASSAQHGNAPPGPDMETLVARQKRVIEEAVQQQLQDKQRAAQPASEETSSDAASSAADHYRQKMRKRFDEFMARREARQRQAAGLNDAPDLNRGTPSPAPAPGGPAQAPARVQPQPFPMPRAPWGMPAVPMYPQPAYPQPPQPYYPQPTLPQQPVQPPTYPQPAQPLPGAPGMPPFGYPPQAPGWY